MMNAKALIALLLVALISAAQGHDYLLSPIPRKGKTGEGNQNTVKPCEPKTADSPKATEIQAGKSMEVVWGNGHTSGTYQLQLAPAAQDTNAANFKTLVNVPASNSKPQSATLTIPADTAPGAYTMRFSWSSGYDNCVDLLVTPSSAAASGNGNNINPITNQVLASGQFLLLADGQSVGVYDSTTGETTCVGGYKVEGAECVRSGLSPGASAAVAVVMILVIAGSVVGALLYIKAKKPLTWAAITMKAGEVKAKITNRA
eukprot:TRINITY_DN868_c0_g1_i1.p1 TRINITY_DN868_c0_g1~~TRINITY_DN868_c0_g1_i1.p1  ORF type:complete len:259 (-),score=84.91 TRINITY_DN868_c0_g1_i1:124-900(-)